jgi:hypothetical protein
MVIAAAELEVENLKKMGLSPCASCRSGAANQKVVSVWALAVLQNKTNANKKKSWGLLQLIIAIFLVNFQILLILSCKLLKTALKLS